MAHQFNVGKIIFRDAEVQGQEFANQAGELFKESLGEIVKTAPELAAKGEKVLASYSRYKFRELSGQSVPADWEYQVKAQLANIKVEGMAISKAQFDNFVMGAIAAGLKAISGIFGGAIGAVADLADLAEKAIK